MEKGGLTRNRIISELTKSPHGALKDFVPVGLQAAKSEPEFTAHLIAWNQKNGQVRDSKAALPIITLSCPEFPADFVENSLAHLALLDPRTFMKALRFGMEIKTDAAKRGREIKRLVHRYLRTLEENWSRWERVAVQHRRTLKALYSLYHVKPKAIADDVLFKGNRPTGSIFEIIAHLKDMGSQEAAGHIMEKKIPFLVAIGALGAKAKEPDLVMAMISRMTPTELVTNTKMLEKLGVKTVPALRAAFEEGLEKAAASKKATFKTTRAAEQMTDEGLKSKLQSLQEKQIKTLGGPSGDWLVLGDRSPSMVACIEAARVVASTLAKMVKGKVHLVFFDGTPSYVDATGLTYDALLAKTKNMGTGSSTSIGCGLQYAMEKHFDINGIAIISDAKENTPPFFADRYKKFAEQSGNEPPVYLYRFHTTMTGGGDIDLADSMSKAGIELQEFDLRGGIDHYAYSNLISTMRESRYSLVEEVMDSPLLTLDSVLKPLRKEVTTNA